MSYADTAACALKYAQAEQQLAGDARLLTAESLLRSRLALAECLLAAGWMPTVDEAASSALDRALLAEPCEALKAAVTDTE